MVLSHLIVRIFAPFAISLQEHFAASRLVGIDRNSVLPTAGVGKLLINGIASRSSSLLGALMIDDCRCVPKR
jgi:hypothetical protein